MKYVLMNAHRESWQQQLICSHVCCILNLRRTLNTNDYMVMETTPNSCDMRQAIICCWHGYICVRQHGTQLLTQVSFLIRHFISITHPAHRQWCSFEENVCIWYNKHRSYTKMSPQHDYIKIQKNLRWICLNFYVN